jgi:hypothetical protein
MTVAIATVRIIIHQGNFFTDFAVIFDSKRG